MKKRLVRLTIILSCAGATSLAIHYSLSQTRDDNRSSVDSKSNENRSGSSNYISPSFFDPIVAGRFQQALFYIKLARSENFHLRQHGLSQLGHFQRLPSTFYVLLGQQLDFPQLIRLARTFDANEHFFPDGLPFVFKVEQNKTIVSNKVEDFDDDKFLFFTIRNFMEKLFDEKIRPLDTISEHYRILFENYFDQVDSATIFDLVQHFQPEHGDISAKAIRRYRSDLELYSTFLHALRGYADRYPVEVVRHNGLQILKFLFEKRRNNVAFGRFIAKILLLLSRDRRTHRSFYAVGWLKLLHQMAVDQNNVVYSLLAATILSNLDRSNENNEFKDETEFHQNFQLNDLPSKSLAMEVLLGEKIQVPPIVEQTETKNRFRRFVDRVKLRRSNEKKDQTSIPAEKPNWIDDQVYGDKIILFSPAFYNINAIETDLRWNQEPLVDVVFFHGLAGSAFKTWRDGSREDDDEQLVKEENDELLELSEETNWDEDVDRKNMLKSSSCWPKDWLSKDLATSHIRIIAVDYESRVSEWEIASLPKNVLRRSLKERAEEISQQLKEAGVGKRPTVWVAHSMGGLLTKYILTDERNQSMRSSTSACVFFSVPHFGAELASYGIRHAFIVRPTIEIQELQPNSPNLMKLHRNFLEFIKTNENIKILSFAENEKTTFSLRYQTVVVPSESSQIDVGQFFVLNKDHILVCKPDSKSTIEYREIRDLIEKIYLQTKVEPRKEVEELFETAFLLSSLLDDGFNFQY